MKRRIFLSFLGTSNYEKCIYNEKNKKSRDVKFVQNAIIELENNNFDKRYIFSTNGAEKNYELLLKETEFEFEKVKILDGKNEREIWQVFQIVYDKIEENDTIVLDITHSLRYLPMLGITLLQYAKFLKNIKIDKICYGLFDPEEHRNGKIEFPIIDITSFSILQDWSLSGHLFLRSGIVEEFGDIARIEFKPSSSNFDKDKDFLYKISGYLKNLSNDIHTNRGINIIENRKINELRNGIKKTRNELYPPFQYILEKIEKEISKFEEKEILNFIYSVEWCIQRNLIQQGITMLQEGLITYLLGKADEEYKDKDLRMEFSNFFGREDFTTKENENNSYNKEKMSQIKREIERRGINFKSLKLRYCEIKNIRNDINHGGFNLDKNKWKNKKLESEIKAENLKKGLHNALNKIKEIILNQDTEG